MQVTRGVAPRDHAFPQGVPPTVFMFAQPLVSATDAQKAAGVCAITAPDIRWGRCDIKAISLLANVLARQQAVDAGCAETVMLRDGFLSEGAASNIFVVKNGVLLAPPPSNLILTGITYDVVLELAAAHGIPYELRAISEAELRSADELWMTSSTKEIMPIVTLDGVPVGSGAPGPLARQMDALYQTLQATGHARMSDETTLLAFPTDFPVKIMGERRDDFAQTMVELVQRHAPDFRAETVEMRASSKGNYLSVTCVVRATSKAQLDALYRDITAHPWVKMAL